MKLTEEEFEEIIWGDEYEKVTAKKIERQSRWTTYVSQVFKKKSDDTLWMLSWGTGSTEIQECDADATLVQVEPKEKTITVYEEIK